MDLWSSCMVTIFYMVYVQVFMFLTPPPLLVVLPIFEENNPSAQLQVGLMMCMLAFCLVLIFQPYPRQR